MTDAPDWRPSASPETLRRRAALLADVRAFFAERGVVEVETPSLAAAGVTDVHLDGLGVNYDGPGAPPSGRLWLQTSPEYAMKRLLAAGMGAIYQVARAFRAGERGARHNPEFTLLEWYRPGLDHEDLMAEVAELAARIAGPRPVRRHAYAALFRTHLGLDPLTAAADEVRECVAAAVPGTTVAGLDRDDGLDLLFGARIAPVLGQDAFDFVTDFPASQAALARLSPRDPRVAERFELFIDGLEIANGFHELTNAAEQRRRFEADREHRVAAGQPVPLIDERLLAALEAGLPDCAGVALGLDRLFMVALGATRIDGVIAFPVERA
ncbi:EF-P lysine aminoacylase EpmA [Arhodomonas aquaeolei]|uniref:EF-P lysine aminoacylase EpmA n=1 Tax=Arhodomonas aquaeolei TaxID=2369 RepID=UPI002168632B|nr:EF-P lysine aminoacylase EpmA [Arhodomonas aquaeolei]MCS4504406.1 EF-P lysine aminoacylase EpmA [Arhodomonas aquaeolei]